MELAIDYFHDPSQCFSVGTGQNRVLVLMPNEPNPVDFFDLYVTNDLVDLIVTEATATSIFIAENH